MNRQIPSTRDHTLGLGPPRAPKGFPDAPTGPRATVAYSADSRGRGGSRGRGRGWHDDFRDRSRDAEYDYRDRREDRGAPIFRGDASFRGDRGREREWNDRDRRDRDSGGFRGRRPSSPGGGFMRGRPRGRGDWDSRSVGRGYDDRDRFRGRSRTPPSRRASVASPPPQAPEVPAFGSVLNNQSASSNALETPAVPPGPPVTVPTGPRSLVKDGRAPVHPRTGFQHRANIVQRARPSSSGTPLEISEIVPQETSKVTNASKRVEVISGLVAKKTTDSPDSSYFTSIGRPSDAVKFVLQRPLPTEIRVEDEEDSDTESGDDMDDYFEAETRKVQDELSKFSFGNVELTIKYASQESAALIPLLEAPERISDDGDEVKESTPPVPDTSTQLHAPVPKPKLSMAFAPSDGEDTDAEEAEALAAVRPQMKTPPISSLPFKPNKLQWWEDPEFLAEMEADAQWQPYLEQELLQKEEARDEHVKKLREEYAGHYRRYLEFCDSDDPAAVKYRAKVAANQKAVSRAASATPAAESRPEGRRAGSRFATEHDMARVLQESKREAQELERSKQAAKAKAASEKEAVIPDMISREEYANFSFHDTSHLISPDRAPAIFGVPPPEDDFTEEECEIFENAYLDTPKNWTKIAAALPGRDYKECIDHYYNVKHRDNLKEKVRKKEKGKKKGRHAGSGSKPKSNALMANLGSRDGETEDGQDVTDGGGERRRPRRAAAPIWPIEAPSESETTTPAQTPGRRNASAAKADTGSETGPPKRKGKGASNREKSAKQAKNGQLIAAAPALSTKSREEEKSLPPGQIMEKPKQGSSESGRFSGQWDGTSSMAHQMMARGSQELFTGLPAGTVDRGFQSYSDQEYAESGPLGMGFDASQGDRRNLPQTSSYWSVPEQTDFPALLQHFGTDWQAIAKWMGTKTHIMVWLAKSV